MAACNFRQRLCREPALHSWRRAHGDSASPCRFACEAAYGLRRSAGTHGVFRYRGAVALSQRFPHDTGRLRRVPPAYTCPFRPRTLAASPRRPVSRGLCAALFMPEPAPRLQCAPVVERGAARPAAMA